jgi:small GTP-binding protein
MASKLHRRRHRASIPPRGVELFFELRDGKARIRTLAFGARGELLVSGGDDGKLRVWKVQSGELVRSFDVQNDEVLGVAFSPISTLAGGGDAGVITLWGAQTGKLLRTINGHHGTIFSIAFEPQHGALLASASYDGTVKLWDTQSGTLVRTFEGHTSSVFNVAFDARGLLLASTSHDGTAKVWEVHSGKLLHTLRRRGDPLSFCGVAFHPHAGTVVTGGDHRTVMLWEVSSGKLLHTLEGHTNTVTSIAFSPNGHLLASASNDQTIRLWSCETWEPVAVIPRSCDASSIIDALAFHPTLPLLAASTGERSKNFRLWKLDLEVLLGQHVGSAAVCAVHHATAKVMLVGDHSVGKSALGYRLIHGTFKEQASTHGQKFWALPVLSQTRADGTECEAILWDLAGQPDYRLVHALFVDNADLALVLFDASNLHDPLHGVEFWLKQLQAGQSRCPVILVAAQTDRGTSSLTSEELAAFCRQHNVAGPISTSALTGSGFDELLATMKAMIPWGDKSATVTTATFKKIKDYVLGLKETKSADEIIVTSKQLRFRLEAVDATWSFTDAEMLTAVGHLDNYGYTKRLRTSKGEERILLEPERLNNLASSFVLEARRNPKGLGALEEKRLLASGYDFPELRDLSASDRDVLLDAAALLFLEHNVCFREADPLRVEPYLVFPELINLKKPEGGWRRLYGVWTDRKCIRLTGGAAWLHTHLHAHRPVEKQRALRDGRRTSLRIPSGCSARW